MSITEIINSGANVTLQVTAAQLGEFAEDLIERTKKRLATEVAEKRSEVYFTRTQTADILNINPSTLWNWERKGYLMPVRFGGLVRYRKSDIDEVLKDKE